MQFSIYYLLLLFPFVTLIVFIVAIDYFLHRRKNRDEANVSTRTIARVKNKNEKLSKYYTCLNIVDVRFSVAL